MRANTRAISGTSRTSVVSICCCILTDCDRLVPGTRAVRTAMSPSSRFGANSSPSRLARGEPADLVILARPALDALVAHADKQAAKKMAA